MKKTFLALAILALIMAACTGRSAQDKAVADEIEQIEAVTSEIDSTIDEIEKSTKEVDELLEEL